MPIGEAIELARRVVDLHDRMLGEEGEGRGWLFLRSWQQLHAAVLILCSEPGPLSQRLADACALGIANMDPDELPGIVQPSLKRLQAELAALAPSDGGLARLPEERARATAARLLLLYVHLLGVRLAARPVPGAAAVAWAG